MHDVNVLDHLVPLPGAYYVMNKGYLDFERLYTLPALICVYLLMAITKKRLNIEQSLYAILQILSVSVFEKMPLLEAFQSADYSNGGGNFCNQLSLWD